MLYKNDLSKKRKFIAGYGCYMLACFLFIVILSLVLSIVLKMNFQFFVFPLVLLLLLYGFSFFRAVKRYDSISVENLEDKLLIKYGKREIIVPFAAIQEILAYPGVIDKKQLMIIYGKWKAVAITSYLENFDELKNLLTTIKPVSKKKGISRKILDYSVVIFILLGLLSQSINNYPVKFIFAGFGLAGAIFSLIRFAKSAIQKSRKVFGILIYSFLTISLVFYVSVEIFVSMNSSYRKNQEGKTVLMNLDSVYKYDKRGNLIYEKSDYVKEKSKYNEKDQIIYYKNITGKYDINYVYENDLLVEVKFSNGDFYKYEYDSQGNKIHYINHNDYEAWYKYDENRNFIGYTDSDGAEEVYVFNENNQKIYEKDEYGDEYFYQYDNEGNCVEEQASDYVKISTYNEKNQLINSRYEYENSRINEVSYSYDEKGNLIYKAYTSSENGMETKKSEIFYLYDKYNNIVKEDTDDYSYEFSYDYDKAGRILRTYSYITYK